MSIFDHNFKEIFSSQIVSQIGGLIAGTVIAIYKDQLLLLPGMLVLLPGFLEMRGNIGGSLSSRISSGLFLGVIHKNKINSKIVRGNLLASFLLGLVISLSLGLIAFLFNYFIFDIMNTKIILLPVLAGILAAIIEVPLALWATFYFFRNKHDPNNIMGPFITTVADIVSVFSLLLVMVVLL